MNNTTLYIKNMVCYRCIMVVEDLLAKLGFTPLHVELGKAIIQETVGKAELEHIRQTLQSVGFELIDDKRNRLIEQIKQEIIRLVHSPETNGITIEKYFISQKIERVKELLVYDELSLNEIAFLLNYSSTAHLSRQFKEVTDTTPSEFKKQKIQLRKELDEIV